MSTRSLRLTCPECRWFAETRELPADAALDEARAQLATHLESEHGHERRQAAGLAKRVAWRPWGRAGK